jgi:exodeoxyribonuclease V alpha subunit
MEHFQGYVERTLYKGAEFAVVLFRPKPASDESQESFTAIGPIPAHKPNELLELHGEWATHPKYGKQFKAASAFQSVPSTGEGMEEFLSHYVHGVGPAKAKLLVKTFGRTCPALLRTRRTSC